MSRMIDADKLIKKLKETRDGVVEKVGNEEGAQGYINVLNANINFVESYSELIGKKINKKPRVFWTLYTIMCSCFFALDVVTSSPIWVIVLVGVGIACGFYQINYGCD